MSRTVAYVKAAPADVFAVLMNPYSYEYWVVGCKRVRSVDDEWPQAGAVFHHTSGAGPLVTNDKTRIVRLDPPHLLELDARAWPAGQARVTLLVDGNDSGSRVELIEEPISGPARRLHNPLLDAAAHARNTVALRRLGRVAEGRL